MQIDAKCAISWAWFTIEAESMVMQQFVVPSYPPPVLVVGLVELLCFTFPSYDWELDNLVGYNKMLANYRDLSPFKDNYTMWFDTKFCATYGTWTFYDKVPTRGQALHSCTVALSSYNTIPIYRT